MHSRRDRKSAAIGSPWKVTTVPDPLNGTLVIRISGPPGRLLRHITSEGERGSQMVIVIGGPP